MVSYESLKSEYERNWANLQIRPARLGEANATARKAINGKATDGRRSDHLSSGDHGD